MENNSKKYEMQDNRLNVFKSTKKTNDAQPDFWGKAVVDGVEKTISLWSKKSEKGSVYLSGTIEDWKGSKSEASADEFLEGDKEKEDVPF